MSFTGTPLNQTRRLDQDAFLGRQIPNNPKSTNDPSRGKPISHTYSTSIKPTRSSSRALQAAQSVPDTNLESYALSKQREQLGESSTAPITARPEKWSVNDTSVQLAQAFQSAALAAHATVPDMQSNNPNYAWASQAPRAPVPRSTSVEYESQSQVVTARRLAAPPSRGRGGRPLERGETTLVVPESQEDRSTTSSFVRGKSPFEAVTGAVGTALGSGASFLMRRRQEKERANTTNEESYDYAEEEREVQRQASQSQLSNQSRRPAPPARRKTMTMPTDNMAYKPTDSDLEVSDEESEEGKRRKRKAKKSGVAGGPPSTISTIGSDKRRKKKSSANNSAEVEDESVDNEQEPSLSQRVTASAVSRPPFSHASTSRRSVPPVEPHALLDQPADYSNAESGLQSIAEVDESGDTSPPEVDGFSEQETQGKLTQYPLQRQSRIFSVGGALGHLVNMGYRLSSTLLAVARDALIALLLLAARPFGWLATHRAPLALLTFGLLLSGAWLVLREPLSRLGRPPAVYYPPSDTPAQDVSELSARLISLESALSGLSLENVRERNRAEQETRTREVLQERIAAMEIKLKDEARRAQEAEERARRIERDTIGELRREIEFLRNTVGAIPKNPTSGAPASGNDNEARARLRLLEERLANMEDGVKEALDVGKTALAKANEKQTAVTVPSASGTPAWWQKLASSTAGKTGSLTLRGPDGQDISAIIAQFVDAAASLIQKDNLARADFALHSGGAAVVPALTSDTYEIRPPTFSGKALALLTGHGYALGRPPVTALHHELHVGHCWPFSGTSGQLGVKLAAPTYIEDITIDHVSREEAFDMRTAPREMELWGLVEGTENLQKMQAYYEAQARKREERRAAAAAGGDASAVEEEEVIPSGLPEDMALRISRFTYDIDAVRHIQTFPVDEEVRALGIDFGVVVLVVKSNWGMDEYTCLYRVRIHGQRMAPQLPPSTPVDETTGEAAEKSS